MQVSKNKVEKERKTLGSYFHPSVGESEVIITKFCTPVRVGYLMICANFSVGISMGVDYVRLCPGLKFRVSHLISFLALQLQHLRAVLVLLIFALDVITYKLLRQYRICISRAIILEAHITQM